jgi:hypothetical protein
MQSEQRLILPTEELSRTIENRKLNGFAINTGHSPRSIAIDLRYYHENENPAALLWCRIEQKAKAPENWTTLIEGLVTQWPCIGGWQWKQLYRKWQWACMHEGYEVSFGPIPPHTKTYNQRKVMGEIWPDRELIDTSLNPGRIKDLLPGIYFVPSAEMWLGPHFWQYAKCTKEEALAADFFIEKRDTPHFLYLKSWPQPFSRPDGEQGRQQQRIWKLFFNEDCEWPPGSGTICDEPMYGPPELMP